MSGLPNPKQLLNSRVSHLADIVEMPEKEEIHHSVVPASTEDLISRGRILKGRAVKDLFKKAFQEDDLRLSELHPYRVMTAWRMNRYILSRTPEYAHQAIFEIPHQLFFSPRTSTTYLEQATKIADKLSLLQGPRLDPKAGWYGLFTLLDSRTAHITFPTLSQVADFEVALVEYATEYLASASLGELKKHLLHQHGFHRYEQNLLVEFSMDNAAQRIQLDEDQERALALLNLDAIAERARKVNDVRAELAAVKTRAVITGITRKAQARTQLEQFEDTITAISGEDAHTEIEAPMGEVQEEDAIYEGEE